MFLQPRPSLLHKHGARVQLDDFDINEIGHASKVDIAGALKYLSYVQVTCCGTV